ncbi:MAG: hypothetical protein ACEPOZ_19925 [Marinifilaceae bacterium]
MVMEENKGWVRFHRKFYESKIAHKPPHYREIFTWLFVNANHKEGISSGRIIQTGQLHTTMEEIRNSLLWHRARGVKKYAESDIEEVLHFLQDAGMISTEQTTTGKMVTIYNYAKYQNPNPITTTDGTLLERQFNDTVNKNKKIKDNKGWVKYHRKLYSEEIAHKPPHFREIFTWLFVNANHKKGKSSGRIIQPGQLHITYEGIAKALHWQTSEGEKTYKKHHIDNTFRFLRNTGMISTAKTTIGTIVTICKYEEYQDFNPIKTTDGTLIERQCNDTINKNKKIKSNKGGTKVLNSKKKYNANNYRIPKEDLFGFSPNEILDRIKVGEYEKIS